MPEHRSDHLRGLSSQLGGGEFRHETTTPGAPAYSTYRDAVRGLMQADEPFGEVEEAIDNADLNEDVRAALWLLAFSMREPRGRPRGTRRLVHSIG